MEENRITKFSKEEIVSALNMKFGKDLKVEDAFFSRSGVRFGGPKPQVRAKKEVIIDEVVM